MGNGIAQVAATSGYQVTCMDLQTAALEKAKATIAKYRPKIFFLYEPAYWQRKNLSIADAQRFFAGFGYDIHIVEFGPRRAVTGEVGLGQVLLAVP